MTLLRNKIFHYINLKDLRTQNYACSINNTERVRLPKGTSNFYWHLCSTAAERTLSTNLKLFRTMYFSTDPIPSQLSIPQNFTSAIFLATFLTYSFQSFNHSSQSFNFKIQSFNFKSFNHSSQTNKNFKLSKNIIRKKVRISYYRGAPIVLAPPPINYKSYTN